jgi:hypothetical protein
LDEVLFPIPGLLDFKARLEEQGGEPMLFLDVFMLSSCEVEAEIEKALAGIPAMQKLSVRMDCVVQPDRMPDLRKRVLLDMR